MSFRILALSLLVFVSLASCARHGTEWLVAENRIATKRVFASIRLGENIRAVLDAIRAEPIAVKPVVYPDRPLKMLERLSERAQGLWPRRKEVRARLGRWLAEDRAISKTEWRRFVFSYDYHSSLPPPHKWQFLDRAIYDSVRLDGSHKIYLVRAFRVYRGTYSIDEDVYWGLLVSPQDMVVAKKLHVCYARERGIQKAILAEDVFLP